MRGLAVPYDPHGRATRAAVQGVAMLITIAVLVRQAKVHIFGEEIALKDLARLSGTARNTIRSRMARGMTAERAAFGHL